MDDETAVRRVPWPGVAPSLGFPLTLVTPRTSLLFVCVYLFSETIAAHQLLRSRGSAHSAGEYTDQVTPERAAALRHRMFTRPEEEEALCLPLVVFVCVWLKRMPYILWPCEADLAR